MNFSALSFCPGHYFDLSQPDTRMIVPSVTVAETKPVYTTPVCDPNAWLASQPGYWRGRASVRQPQPGVDVWSEQALRDARAIGEFELMAEQCEGK